MILMNETVYGRPISDKVSELAFQKISCSIAIDDVNVFL